MMAHLAYEALEIVTTNPGVDNAQLLEALTPFVSLVIQRTILSPPQQMGLTGELLLLVELLNFAEQHEPPIDKRLALGAWKGWDSASRDFLGDNVALEVKTTGQESRRHAVHPIHQLLPDPDRPDERVYVYSVGLRPDRSQSFGLLSAFDRIDSRLESDETQIFLHQLSQYGGWGFDPELRSYYELEVGFSTPHPPALYRVDNLPDILRPESFVGGSPPERASRISYELSLEGLQPCSRADRESVLRQLLVRP